MSKIPEYILCKDADLAQQVLEKIERESDLRWHCDEKKPTEFTPKEYYPDMVISISGGKLMFASRGLEIKNGITNFTKAEDFLNNTYMTNKTWDNLEVNDVLIDENGNERNIGGIIDHLVGLAHRSFTDEAYSWFSKDSLIRIGYKIKGASEDKPSIDDVIDKLNSVNGYASRDDEKLVEAIEMLKKLK